MSPRTPTPLGPPAEVRIIGGHLRRSRLPVANKPGLRPTPDRVRETLFNWLGQDLTGWRCLDAFAGAGALGFEAASRGAAEVLLVEWDTQLAASLQKVALRLGVQVAVSVKRADGIAVLTQAPPSYYDLVFLDPPFDSSLMPAALRAATKALRPGGWLYVESPKAVALPSDEFPGLIPYRHLKAGQVFAQLLQRTPHANG